ncbi:HvfA family oxazolone/thioamide-modified RiPP metallophore [Sulfurirhabdus autotrophica]|uniref:Low-complexity protein n=1 Tax=Sulfurirhabdus autotrophica TaxID=1706046 RepID=A0A4R3Y112_9PROT|nr:hypothetical protein [Sulfurirhabdus autotrophica]TCV85167.1 hypothetical protein EDC63_11056 [Sulfurirhabdus autotrophica]
MAINKSALTIALGTAFVATLSASPVVNAAGNPFAMQTLDKGYMVAGADAKAKDGKCAGDKAAATKAKDGKCGDMSENSKDNMKATDKKMPDGKCGEAKCGASKAKAGDKAAQ